MVFFWEGGGSLVVLWVVLWGFFLRALGGAFGGCFGSVMDLRNSFFIDQEQVDYFGNNKFNILAI